MAVEGLSAARTALNGTPEDIVSLQKILAKMKAALDDEKAFAALDLEFHTTLANASQNTLVSDLISLIRGQLVKTLHKVLPLPYALQLSQKEQTAIVKAIELRDAEGARKAMHAHLEGHLKRFADANQDASVSPKSHPKLN